MKKRKKRIFRSPKKKAELPLAKLNIQKAKKRGFFESVYGIITIVVTLLGLLGFLTLKDEIHNLFTTKEEKWEEEKFIKGILIPNYTFENQSNLIFQIGSMSLVLKLSDLRDKPQTIEVNKTINNNEEANPFKIMMYLMNNRLYISSYFKDIQKEEIVGRISYNKWSLFKDNLLNFNETDSSIHVYDRGGNTIFWLGFKSPNSISFEGYFVGDKIITCVNKKALVFYLKNDSIQHIKALSAIKAIGDDL